MDILGRTPPAALLAAQKDLVLTLRKAVLDNEASSLEDIVALARSAIKPDAAYDEKEARVATAGAIAEALHSLGRSEEAIMFIKHCVLGRRHASLARDEFFAAAVTRPWGLHVSLASLCSRNALAMLDWLQSALFLVDKARRAEGDEGGADRLHSDELLTQRTQILVGMSIATRKSNGAEGEAALHLTAAWDVLAIRFAALLEGAPAEDTPVKDVPTALLGLAARVAMDLSVPVANAGDRPAGLRFAQTAVRLYQRIPAEDAEPYRQLGFTCLQRLGHSLCNEGLFVDGDRHFAASLPLLQAWAATNPKGCLTTFHDSALAMANAMLRGLRQMDGGPPAAAAKALVYLSLDLAYLQENLDDVPASKEEGAPLVAHPAIAKIAAMVDKYAKIASGETVVEAEPEPDSEAAKAAAVAKARAELAAKGKGKGKGKAKAKSKPKGKGKGKGKQ